MEVMVKHCPYLANMENLYANYKQLPWNLQMIVDVNKELRNKGWT